jgi:hypothetical protein
MQNFGFFFLGFFFPPLLHWLPPRSMPNQPKKLKYTTSSGMHFLKGDSRPFSLGFDYGFNISAGTHRGHQEGMALILFFLMRTQLMFIKEMSVLYFLHFIINFYLTFYFIFL